MKQTLVFLCVCVSVVTLWAEPALVLMERGDLKALEGRASVLRHLRYESFVAAEISDLEAAGVAYRIIDEKYIPDHYLLVRGHQQVQRKGLPVLWQDIKGALVRLPAPMDEYITERVGGEVPLETPPPIRRESRPPSHLDDPALDQWLEDLSNEVNADTLFGFVSTLASYNRYTRWTSNDDAAAWILNKFESYNLDSAYYHEFTATGSGWSRTAKNIVAVKNGAVYPDSIIVIGGHMDATSQSPSTAAPGADDNATGTAGTIEAARLLSQYSFSHTLMFMAFNGEEQGLQGSDALADAMAAAGREVVAMLNMDMIGYYDPADEDLFIEGFFTGTSSAWLMDVLWDNCLQFTALAPYLYQSDGWGSDHVSFHNAGYPAVLSIENEYGSYPCYHNTCDLPDQITASFLREMALVNILSGAELAGPLGTGSISGTVSLEGTSDYSGVTVSVVGGTAGAVSLVSGYYLVESLLAGSYDLAFAKTGWLADTLTGIIVLEAQETSGQNIFLSAAAPGSVAGTIMLSGGGGALTDGIVYIEGTVDNVNPDGSYLISPVYAGQYPITAALDDYALGSQVVTLTDGQNLTGVDLTLHPFWDLEASDYNLDNGGTGWGWGIDGIAGSHSPSNVWGTELSGDYTNCGDYRLEMPPVCLANLDSARLTVWHWYDIEPSGPTVDYDGANVKLAVFGTENWQVINPDGGYPEGAGYTCNPIQNQAAYNGATGGWLQAVFNLDAFLGQSVKLMFHLGSDVGVPHRGWYLDDLALTGWHSVPTTPDAVEDLIILQSGADMRLSWSPSSGATQYKVYRGPEAYQPIGAMTLVSTETDTTYLDEDTAGLTNAFYLIIAEN